jgi:hypothetical protein
MLKFCSWVSCDKVLYVELTTAVRYLQESQGGRYHRQFESLRPLEPKQQPRVVYPFKSKDEH